MSAVERRIEGSLYEGESVREVFDVGPTGVVVTTHRVFVASPDHEGVRQAELPGVGGCRPDDPWPGLVAGLGSHSVSSGCAVSCSRSPSPGVGCSTPRSSGPTRPVESGPVNWSTRSRGSSGCSRVPTRCCSGSARSHSCSGGSPRRTTRAPRADTHRSARRRAGYPHPARARPRRGSGASRTAARPRTVRGAPRHRNEVTATARATGPTVSTPGGPKRGHVSGGPGDGPLQRPG